MILRYSRGQWYENLLELRHTCEEQKRVSVQEEVIGLHVCPFDFQQHQKHDKLLPSNGRKRIRSPLPPIHHPVNNIIVLPIDERDEDNTQRQRIIETRFK